MRQLSYGWPDMNRLRLHHYLLCLAAIILFCCDALSQQDGLREPVANPYFYRQPNDDMVCTRNHSPRILQCILQCILHSVPALNALCLAWHRLHGLPYLLVWN